jgi:hypothetical protein
MERAEYLRRVGELQKLQATLKFLFKYQQFKKFDKKVLQLEYEYEDFLGCIAKLGNRVLPELSEAEKNEIVQA